eukprot:TRINITY_DN9356_c0_g2_i1.p1 TRINITY_DN9356_c0_g2~~TRINITY_DN9356_c0_g2_i1.p1  ORF type:complete len:1022 (-),score=253.54 TRINITY_DN9356_c0_g2_i1:426-3416(-)
MAEAEDVEENEGISRIQEKCQIAATLMGEWPPLIRSNSASSPGSKNKVLNKLLSSKQRLLSLASSPSQLQKGPASPTTDTFNVKDDRENKGSPVTMSDDSDSSLKVLKKLMPGPKVRDAFRKFMDKEDEEADKSKEENSKDEKSKKQKTNEDKSKEAKDEKQKDDKCRDSERESFFRKFLRDAKDDEEKEVNDLSHSDSLLKRFFRDKSFTEDRSVGKSSEDDEKDGFFRKFLRDAKDDEEKSVHDLSHSDGLLKRLFRDKGFSEDKSTGKSAEDDEKDGFFRRLFKDKNEDRDKKDGQDKADDEDKGHTSCEDEEGSEFFLFRRLFRVHPEEERPGASPNENSAESSPGTESFFKRLFRDRDRSVEDSELFSLKRLREKRPGSPRQRSDRSATKPPLPNNTPSKIRKGTYHVSLDFVQQLCDTSYGLLDVFPMEERRKALRESLMEINGLLTASQNEGGVCFPMGKGLYRVVHIPEDEAVLLNSREKAPYLICVEVLKAETQSSSSENKDTTPNKLSRGGIPLANGDVQLHRPPPWAFPLWNQHDTRLSGTDQMLRSASQAIDQAMSHLWEARVKFVHVSLSVQKQCPTVQSFSELETGFENGQRSQNSANGSESVMRDRTSDNDWVHVTLSAIPGVNMEDVEEEAPERRKEHRRVPSTIAMAEVKAAAAKGESPLGLPVSKSGRRSSNSDSEKTNGGQPKATDALAGELWEVKKERIRRSSIYGKLPGWDLCSVIVKSGDDCRQEHLAVQLISHLYDIFQEAGLPLWLRPYEVLVTSSYTALIETIPDTASLHAIKSRLPHISSLREFFEEKYEEHSPAFKLAQRNFVESMAGYSILCYLLQVKDRHNGNLLIDEEGHIIHIDFGFMLSNSPGGVNFESAPFKLTRELLEVMDSDAEGSPSEFFDYFKVLCIQGFLTCRKHAERIILLVEMLQDSGFPCFKGGPRTIHNLRKRFHLGLTEEQCVSLVLSLISSSLDAWRTRQYDYYQRVLNGIL